MLEEDYHIIFIAPSCRASQIDKYLTLWRQHLMELNWTVTTKLNMIQHITTECCQVFLSRTCLWKLSVCTFYSQNCKLCTPHLCRVKMDGYVSYFPWLTSWEEDVTAIVIGQSQLLAICTASHVTASHGCMSECSCRQLAGLISADTELTDQQLWQHMQYLHTAACSDWLWRKWLYTSPGHPVCLQLYTVKQLNASFVLYLPNFWVLITWMLWAISGKAEKQG